MVPSAAQPGNSGPTDSGVSRRGFLTRSAAVSAGVAVGGQLVPAPAGAAPGAARAAPEAAPPAAPPAAPAADTGVEVALTVNGRAQRLTVDPRTTLLDALREGLDLTGTKKGCDRGQCGSCTVHVAGRAVLSCLTLAVATAGAEVTTVEGLASGDRPHPVQQAFADADALQCGFCTPGMIMSAVALTGDGRTRTYDEIREGMSGNLCRCGTYPNVVEAVQTVQKQRSG